MGLKVSGDAVNRVVTISGVVSPASFIRGDVEGIVFTDNEDGTVSVTLPQSVEEGTAIKIRWQDEEGAYSTVCSVPRSEQVLTNSYLRSLIQDLEDRIAVLER